MDPITIQVRDFTGCRFAVSAEGGNRLHDRIAPLLCAGTPVALSFAGIETVIAAFLGAAIGRLCTRFGNRELGNLLTFRDLSPDNRAMAERSFVTPEGTTPTEGPMMRFGQRNLAAKPLLLRSRPGICQLESD